MTRKTTSPPKDKKKTFAFWIPNLSNILGDTDYFVILETVEGKLLSPGLTCDSF